MSHVQADSLYVALDDRFVPKVFGQIVAQRPSLLNYATPYFRQTPKSICVPIAVPHNGAPLFTPLDPIQLGFGNHLPGMEMLLQVLDIRIGFGVDVGLPPILRPLPPQRIAVLISFAARFSVPRIDPTTVHCPDGGGANEAHATMDLCDCFRGTLAATLVSSIKVCGDKWYITYGFDQFDTDNLTPVGLRQTFDRIVVLAMDTVVLPKLWAAVSPFKLDLTKILPAGSPITSITLKPIQGHTLPDPNIANHLLEAWFNLQVTAP